MSEQLQAPQQIDEEFDEQQQLIQQGIERGLAEQQLLGRARRRQALTDLAQRSRAGATAIRQQLAAAKDQTLQATDVRVIEPEGYNAQAKLAFEDGIIQYADSTNNRSKVIALGNIANWTDGKRKTVTASQEEIQDYLNNLPTGIPAGLKSVLKSLFPGINYQVQAIGEVNNDLVTAVSQAFQKYNKKKGGYGIRLSTKYMYKPTNAASGYDRVVLLQARRIARRLIASLSALRMKSDKTLSKDYAAQKGLYNQFKVQLSTEKLNAMKSRARRYGTANPQEAALAAQAKSTAFITRMRERATSKIDQSRDAYNNAISTPYNATNAFEIYNAIPLVKKMPGSTQNYQQLYNQQTQQINARRNPQ